MNEKTTARFPNTAWTQLDAAASSPEAHAELLKQYWAPVYAFLRRSGRDRENAAETTQAFFVDIVLHRDLFSKADQGRGRFRSLLLKSLQNYTIDRSRKHRHRSVSLDDVLLDRISMDAAEPDPGLDPDTAFNRQWASSILQMAIERVREDCQKRSMQNHWTAFELRVLRPAIGLTKPPAIEQIKDIVSAKDTQQVSHMIQSVKRKMESAVREIVASTLENQSELEQETSSVLWHTRLG